MEDLNVVRLSKEEENSGERLPNVLSLSDFATDYDPIEFNRGVREASYLAGFFVTLVDAGMIPNDAFQIVSNKLVLDNEVKLAELNQVAALREALETISDEDSL